MEKMNCSALQAEQFCSRFLFILTHPQSYNLVWKLISFSDK